MTRFRQTPKAHFGAVFFSEGEGVVVAAVQVVLLLTLMLCSRASAKMKRRVKEADEILDMIRPIHNLVIVAGDISFR